MRVTGGALRNRHVHAPRGRAVRPTPGRVREALFSILGAEVAQARVLDLYAGTGALGFEALSRGAAHVTFVEAHRPTAAALRAAAEQFGVAERSEVFAAPAERAAKLLVGRYDLVLADPPYALGFPAPAFAALAAAGLIDAQTTVVLEHAGRLPLPPTPGFIALRTERYGDVALSFLRSRREGDGLFVTPSDDGTQ